MFPKIPFGFRSDFINPETKKETNIKQINVLKNNLGS